MLQILIVDVFTFLNPQKVPHDKCEILCQQKLDFTVNTRQKKRKLMRILIAPSGLVCR